MKAKWVETSLGVAYCCANLRCSCVVASGTDHVRLLLVMTSIDIVATGFISVYLSPWRSVSRITFQVITWKNTNILRWRTSAIISSRRTFHCPSTWMLKPRNTDNRPRGPAAGADFRRGVDFITADTNSFFYRRKFLECKLNFARHYSVSDHSCRILRWEIRVYLDHIRRKQI